MIAIQRILFATDFSECSNRARELACTLAERFEAELHLLHVIHDVAVEVPEFGMGLAFPGYLENIGQMKRDATAKALEKLQAELTDRWSGLKTEAAVRIGVPASKVVEYAEEHQCDLIVIGTHGRTGLPHVLLGSVAERIIQHAPCPVTTVRHT